MGVVVSSRGPGRGLRRRRYNTKVPSGRHKRQPECDRPDRIAAGRTRTPRTTRKVSARPPGHPEQPEKSPPGRPGGRTGAGFVRAAGDGSWPDPNPAGPGLPVRADAVGPTPVGSPTGRAVAPRVSKPARAGDLIAHPVITTTPASTRAARAVSSQTENRRGRTLRGVPPAPDPQRPTVVRERRQLLVSNRNGIAGFWLPSEAAQTNAELRPLRIAPATGAMAPVNQQSNGRRRRAELHVPGRNHAPGRPAGRPA